MYFVVMPNRNHSEHLGMFCIVMPSIFVNCPAVICLPNIASYLRETPLVICGPWSYFYILFTTPAAIICFLLLAAFPAVFHTIRLTLCFCKTGEIDNFSVSCWAKFWFVSVQIPRWCKLPSARGSQHQQPSDRSSSPTGLITLGRLFKGKLLLSTS